MAGLVGMDPGPDGTCGQRFTWDETLGLGAARAAGQAEFLSGRHRLWHQAKYPAPLAGAGCGSNVVPASKTPAEEHHRDFKPDASFSQWPGRSGSHRQLCGAGLIRRHIDQGFLTSASVSAYQMLGLEAVPRTMKMHRASGATPSCRIHHHGKVRDHLHENQGFAVTIAPTLRRRGREPCVPVRRLELTASRSRTGGLLGANPPMLTGPAASHICSVDSPA